MTVDNLFMIHGKVSVFPGFDRRGRNGAWFLNSINNKLTIELLKK
jgi:hypothetical protein